MGEAASKAEPTLMQTPFPIHARMRRRGTSFPGESSLALAILLGHGVRPMGPIGLLSGAGFCGL